jgi:hypothetical protein
VVDQSATGTGHDKEQDLNNVDEQPVNQDSMVIEVVVGGKDLCWVAAVPDDGESIYVAAGHDMDII